LQKAATKFTFESFETIVQWCVYFALLDTVHHKKQDREFVFTNQRRSSNLGFRTLHTDNSAAVFMSM